MEDKIIDYLEGRLSVEETAAVEQYIAKNPKAIDGLELLNKKLSALSTPEPSAKMRQDFYTNLSSWKKEEQKEGVWRKIQHTISSLNITRWLPRVAFSLTLLLGGVWIGYQMRGNQALEELEAMTQQTQQMQKVLMLSMLEQNTATKRIKAVNMAESMVATDDKIIEVLVHTLNNDQNVNVRITAAETLSRYVQLPTVRHHLVAALPLQTSPLVQLTLVDALLQLQNKEAINALETLVKEASTNEAIREKVEQGLLMNGKGA